MLNGWRVRLTSRGTVHMVKHQDQQYTCGIACAAMVNYKMKKGWIAAGLAADAALTVSVPIFGSFIGGELTRRAIDYAVRSEPEVYKVYAEVTGTVYDGSTTTDLMAMPDVLKRLNCGDWETQSVPAGQVGGYIAAAIARGAPVIAAVEWPNGSGHAVVVDSVINGDSCFYVCDPGDGQVHVTDRRDGSPVVYRNVGRFSGNFCGMKFGATYDPAQG